MSKKNEQALVKHGRGRSSGRTRTRAVDPITGHHHYQTSSIVGSTKEIHVVEEEAVESIDALSNKVHDMPKNTRRLREMGRSMISSIKYEENSTANQESWSNRIKISQLKNDKSVEKFAKGGQVIVSDQLGPVVGALTMTTILIVMLICGKLCAIICTAAWFYTAPLIRSRNTNSTLDVDELKVIGSDLNEVDSPEYKKRVVLQGFLSRD